MRRGSRMKGRWMIEANGDEERGSRMSGVGDRG